MPVIPRAQRRLIVPYMARGPGKSCNKGLQTVGNALLVHNHRSGPIAIKVEKNR
jgi:hypothetical protein